MLFGLLVTWCEFLDILKAVPLKSNFCTRSGSQASLLRECERGFVLPREHKTPFTLSHERAAGAQKTVTQ